MVIFFSTLLMLSVLGLATLIGVRHYELTNGTIVLRRVRPAAGALLGGALHFVERHLPALVVRCIRQGTEALVVFAQRAVALLILHTERGLESTLRTIRYNTHIANTKEASQFLREVALHKQSLQSAPKGERAIYEE